MTYEKATEGIRVQVVPRFSLADSAPEDGTFVFTYHVNVRNESDSPAQLMFRHWRIHDSAGDDSIVDGEGVIGRQPRLEPGESHEYRSYCVLRSPVGFMEGYYTFERADGSEFRVEVPRFELQGPLVIPTHQPVDWEDEDEDPAPMH